MSAKTILCALSFVVSGTITAQAPASGTFVSMLGVYTAAAERYTRTRDKRTRDKRTRDKLEGDILLTFTSTDNAGFAESMRN